MYIRQFLMIFYNNFIGELFKVKRNVLFVFIPLIVSFCLYFAVANDIGSDENNKDIQIGLVIEDNNIYTQMLADSFDGNDTFQNYVQVTTGEEKDIMDKFYDGQLTAVIHVPKGFVDEAMYFGYNPIKVYISNEDPIIARAIHKLLLGYEKYMSSIELGVYTLYDSMEQLDFEKEMLYKYNEKIAVKLGFTALRRDRLYIVHEVRGRPNENTVIYYFIGVLLTMIMYMTAFLSIQIVKERREMCFSRLILTPMPIFLYLFGKILSSCLFVFNILFIWLGVIELAVGIPECGSFAEMLILIYVFSVYSICIFLLASLMIKREESLILFINFYILIQSIIGGSLIPLPLMPDNLLKLSMVTSNHWVVKGLLDFQTGLYMEEGRIVTYGLLFCSIAIIVLVSNRYRKMTDD